MKNSDRNTSKIRFHVEYLGDKGGSATSHAPYRQSEMFELIWIKKGNGAFTIDLENRQIRDNTLLCIFPGQINRFIAAQEVVGYKIAFSEEFLGSGNTYAHLPPALDYAARDRHSQTLTLTHEAQSKVQEIVDMILWEYSNRPSMWPQMLHGLLKMLIAHFSQRNDAQMRLPSNDRMVFGRFMTLLDKNFTWQRQVSGYASDLAVTSNYLSEVVKRVSGHSASIHIQRRVLLEAKRKAVSSDNSMKAIARELGFEDSSTFSKFFKTQTGINFTDFRSSWNNGCPRS